MATLGDPVNSELPVVCRLTVSKKGLIPTPHALGYSRARETVLQALKPFVPDIARYGLYSLRSGGATAANSAHSPLPLISRHGRWKSDKARDVYVKPSTQDALLTSKSLGI